MSKQRYALGLMAIAGMLIAGGCQSTDVAWEGGVPHYANADEDWWNYQMIYHPDARAYYEPYSQRHFWYENGTWREGDAFPPQLPFDPDRARVVKVRDIDPELVHATISALHRSTVSIPSRFEAPVLQEFEIAGETQTPIDADVESEFTTMIAEVEDSGVESAIPTDGFQFIEFNEDAIIEEAEELEEEQVAGAEEEMP